MQAVYIVYTLAEEGKSGDVQRKIEKNCIYVEQQYKRIYINKQNMCIQITLSDIYLLIVITYLLLL